jgi:hypothetical protein
VVISTWACVTFRLILTCPRSLDGFLSGVVARYALELLGVFMALVEVHGCYVVLERRFDWVWENTNYFQGRPGPWLGSTLG